MQQIAILAKAMEWLTTQMDEMHANLSMSKAKRTIPNLQIMVSMLAKKNETKKIREFYTHWTWN